MSSRFNGQQNPLTPTARCHSILLCRSGAGLDVVSLVLNSKSNAKFQKCKLESHRWAPALDLWLWNNLKSTQVCFLSVNIVDHLSSQSVQALSYVPWTIRWCQDMSGRDPGNFIWFDLHLHQLLVPVSQDEPHRGPCSPICPSNPAPGDNFGLHLQTFLPRHLHLQGSSLPPGTLLQSQGGVCTLQYDVHSPWWCPRHNFHWAYLDSSPHQSFFGKQDLFEEVAFLPTSGCWGSPGYQTSWHIPCTK